MIDSETTLFLMFLIMLYLVETYRKLHVLNALYLIVIPIYVIANWTDLHVWYALFILLTNLVLNVAFLVVKFQNEHTT